jgi:hypothetical protein
MFEIYNLTKMVLLHSVRFCCFFFARLPRLVWCPAGLLAGGPVLEMRSVLYGNFDIQIESFDLIMA